MGIEKNDIIYCSKETEENPEFVNIFGNGTGPKKIIVSQNDLERLCVNILCTGGKRYPLSEELVAKDVSYGGANFTYIRGEHHNHNSAVWVRNIDENNIQRVEGLLGYKNNK